MSAPDLPPPVTRPQGLDGCLVALLVLMGIILLLPGLCSLVFIVAMLGGAEDFLGLWLISFAISAGGLWLITYVVRNRRPTV